MAPRQSPSTLPVLLSQALVAFTIEMDNETELRLHHSTTRHGKTGGEGTRGPWLTSFAMYANVLRYVDDEGTTVGLVGERARTSRLQLGGLQRWRYLTVRPPPGQPQRKPPQPECTVELTAGGRRACRAWAEMPALVETRWRTRFGDDAMDGLRQALGGLFDVLSFETPAFLPMVFPTQTGKAEPLAPRAATPKGTRTAASAPWTELSALLSGVLLSFTVDFEAEARVAMSTGANTLRVLRPASDPEPVRLRDLPRLTGISKEANAMCIGWLERHGCVDVVADPSGGRGKVVRLTAKGRGAQAKHQRLVHSTDAAWRAAYGAGRVERLVAALTPIVGDGALPSSPLAAGLEPQEGNWRASVRRPATLPHYPMVLHRGGYPDGS